MAVMSVTVAQVLPSSEECLWAVLLGSCHGTNQHVFAEFPSRHALAVHVQCPAASQNSPVARRRFSRLIATSRSASAVEMVFLGLVQAWCAVACFYTSFSDPDIPHQTLVDAKGAWKADQAACESIFTFILASLSITCRS